VALGGVEFGGIAHGRDGIIWHDQSLARLAPDQLRSELWAHRNSVSKPGGRLVPARRVARLAFTRSAQDRHSALRTILAPYVSTDVFYTGGIEMRDAPERFLDLRLISTELRFERGHGGGLQLGHLHSLIQRPPSVPRNPAG